MARPDVLELLTEYNAGIFDEETLLVRLDQMECSAAELEEAEMVLDTQGPR